MAAVPTTGGTGMELAIIPGSHAKTVLSTAGITTKPTTCPKCTYLNPAGRSTCEVCGATLPVPKAATAAEQAKTPIATAVAQLDDIEAALDDLNVRVTNNGGKPTPAMVDELKVHDAALTGISVNLDNIKSRERTIRFERKKQYARIRTLDATITRLMPSYVREEEHMRSVMKEAARQQPGVYAVSGEELSHNIDIAAPVDDATLEALQPGERKTNDSAAGMASIAEEAGANDEAKASGEAQDEAKGDTDNNAEDEAKGGTDNNAEDEAKAPPPATDAPAPAPAPEPAPPPVDLAAEALRLKEVGNSYWRVGNHAAAESAYLRGLSADPRNIALYNNLAAAQLKLGKYQDVVAAAGVALELSDNTNAKALFRRAKARLELGEGKEAIADVLAALDLEPDNETMTAWLHMARARVGSLG